MLFSVAPKTDRMASLPKAKRTTRMILLRISRETAFPHTFPCALVIFHSLTDTQECGTAVTCH